MTAHLPKPPEATKGSGPLALTASADSSSWSQPRTTLSASIEAPLKASGQKLYIGDLNARETDQFLESTVSGSVNKRGKEFLFTAAHRFMAQSHYNTAWQSSVDATAAAQQSPGAKATKKIQKLRSHNHARSRQVR